MKIHLKQVYISFDNYETDVILIIFATSLNDIALIYATSKRSL